MRISHFTLAEAAAWDTALLARDPLADIYFRPAYLAAIETTGEGYAEALLLKDGPNWLYIPYLRAPAQIRGANYGGPLGKGSPDFLADAWEMIWRAWRAMVPDAREAFLRLHPMMPEQAALLPGWRVEDNRETVSIDLHFRALSFAGPERASHRNKVQRANVLGLSASGEMLNGPLLLEFGRLYGAAMARLGAAEHYRYSAEYFQALLRMRGDVLCYSVRERNAVPGAVAMALILLGPELAHYHLAARREDAPNCALNALLQLVADDAWRSGLEAVHLGGGLTPADDDPLLAFKRGIGNARHRFLTATKDL